jgi:hypothetical protein
MVAYKNQSKNHGACYKSMDIIEVLWHNNRRYMVITTHMTYLCTAVVFT